MPTGRNTLHVHAPVTLGRDGQHVSFFVLEDSPGRFYLTDSHTTAMHAMDHGAKLTPSRLQKIGQIPGAHRAKISMDGEITAEGDASGLQLALWDALRLALAISDNEVNWIPKTRQERFATQVARSLRLHLPEGSIVSKPKLLGVSGHQIEFPLGVLLPHGGIRAIQPIGVSDEHTIDWGYLYQSSGKLVDFKKASTPDVNNRVVVLEDGAPAEELGRAATVLSDSARVLIFNGSREFADMLLAP